MAKYSLAVILMAIFMLGACFSPKSAGPTLPNYKNWPSYSMQKVSFVLHGKPVELRIEIHERAEDNRRSGVFVWNDSNAKPWFLIYGYKIYEPPSGEMYLFEIKNNEWVFVKNFSGNADQEMLAFIKTRYGFTE